MVEIVHLYHQIISTTKWERETSTSFTKDQAQVIANDIGLFSCLAFVCFSHVHVASVTRMSRHVCFSHAYVTSRLLKSRLLKSRVCHITFASVTHMSRHVCLSHICLCHAYVTSRLLKSRLLMSCLLYVLTIVSTNWLGIGYWTLLLLFHVWMLIKGHWPFSQLLLLFLLFSFPLSQFRSGLDSECHTLSSARSITHSGIETVSSLNACLCIISLYFVWLSLHVLSFPFSNICWSTSFLLQVVLPSVPLFHALSRPRMVLHPFTPAGHVLFIISFICCYSVLFC